MRAEILDFARGAQAKYQVLEFWIDTSVGFELAKDDAELAYGEEFLAKGGFEILRAELSRLIASEESLFSDDSHIFFHWVGDFEITWLRGGG